MRNYTCCECGASAVRTKPASNGRWIPPLWRHIDGHYWCSDCHDAWQRYYYDHKRGVRGPRDGDTPLGEWHDLHEVYGTAPLHIRRVTANLAYLDDLDGMIDC